MNNNYSKGFFFVIPEGNELRMYDPNGNQVVGEIWCRITDCAGEMPKAIFKTCVNICSSTDEMKQVIESFQ